MRRSPTNAVSTEEKNAQITTISGPVLPNLRQCRSPEQAARIATKRRLLEFIQTLETRRAELGISRSAIARELGVTQPMISRLFSGHVQNIELRTMGNEHPMGWWATMKERVTLTLCKLLCFVSIHGVGGSARSSGRGGRRAHRQRQARRPTCYCPQREHGNRRETTAAPPDTGPHRRHAPRRQRHPGWRCQRLHDRESRDRGDRPRGRLPRRRCSSRPVRVYSDDERDVAR